MKITNIYPEKLEEFIIRNPQYVPRLIDDDKLKIYHRYWFALSEQFGKVQDMYIVDDYIYYTVKNSESLYSTYTFPEKEIVYELPIDKIGLEDIDIVNNKNSYCGYQIKYWFFLHVNTYNKDKYYKFLSYINQNSKNLILDNKYYFVYGDLENNIYKNCKFVFDKVKNNNG